MRRDFLNPTNILIILYDASHTVVGFTHAKPVEEHFPERESERGETIVIWNTIIEKQHRGKNLVGKMMRQLECMLKEKGYKYIERYAAVANNYAANVQKNYHDRILQQHNHDSRYGPQIFFRIML